MQTRTDATLIASRELRDAPHHAELGDSVIRTNILLVDDRPQNLIALEAILEPLGQNIVKARSGEEALRQLLDSDFAVILLDVLMPGLDGFETAALMKERAKSRHIPIIFLTAVSQHETHVARGYTLGAVDYITKPFHPDVLRAKVAVFVELYRKNEQIRQQAEQLRLNEQRERERAIEELRRLGEARYQALAESMPQIVWTASPDGTITYWNRRWYDYTGISEGAPTADDWRRMVHLDDLVALEDAWRSAREGAKSFEVAVRLRRKSDASYRWHLMRANCSPDENGATGDWIGTSTDIDDRKRAEDGLRFLANASRLLAGSLDYQRTLVALADLTVHSISDWCAIDLRHDDGTFHRLTLAHANAEKVALAHELERNFPPAPDGFFGGERRGEPGAIKLVDCPSGDVDAANITNQEHLVLLRELQLESWLQVPFTVRGETVGFIRLATAESGRRYGPADLSLAETLARRIASTIDIARLYEVAQREATSLAAASRAKDEFLAVLSHELRSPLNAMLGWVQMLRAGLLDEKTSQVALEAIERNVKSQARLIGDILDISRIITGKLLLNLTRLELAAVIDRALDTVRVAAQAKHIEIVTHITDGVPPVQGDEERLQQVVWNLLSNAVKFTPQNGRIEIELTHDDATVRFSVRDNGIGINRDLLPFIFDRFRQGDSSTTRTTGGLGLGLSIVRHLVEMHGGQVRAESDGPGLGATMIVTLPYNARVTPTPERVEPARASVHARALAGLRALVVEDLADGRTLFQAMLEQGGAIVRSVATAAEAFDAIEREWPDVLLSDIGLPGEDGYQLLGRIRRLERDLGRSLPAIAVTAFASDSDREQALAAGFDEHLTKPVELSVLLNTIASLVHRSRV